MVVEFNLGALALPYEEQANVLGLTLGDKAEYVQKMGNV